MFPGDVQDPDGAFNNSRYIYDLPTVVTPVNNVGVTCMQHLVKLSIAIIDIVATIPQMILVSDFYVNPCSLKTRTETIILLRCIFALKSD